ncbi:hypothetical protein B0I37DRAFT_377954 [Chaetomium sp. MPI-CAGE-AT-0009]|nr:hypothetical protein B0I37DRAFT_377954 [Chaetomium sp. MPI-CAGE-AT-0009]
MASFRFGTWTALCLGIWRLVVIPGFLISRLWKMSCLLLLMMFCTILTKLFSNKCTWPIWPTI